MQKIDYSFAGTLEYLVQGKAWGRSVTAAAVDSGQYAPLSAVRNLISPPCCGRQVLFADKLKLDHKAKPEVLQSVTNLPARRPSMKPTSCWFLYHAEFLAVDRNAVQLLQFGTSWAT